jgi:hypothetical protein
MCGNSNRSFGLLIGGVLLLVAGLHYWKGRPDYFVWLILVGAPGLAFVNFAKSFGSPYTTGVVLFALLAIACVLVALIVHVLVELPLRFVTVPALAGLETLVWRPRATPVPVIQPATSGPGANAN